MTAFSRSLAVLAFLAACHGRGQAAEGFETRELVLYQPDAVLRQRVPSVELLTEYVKKLEKVCQEHFARKTEAANLVVVVGVRPGKQSKMWFIPSESADATGTMTKLREKLEAVTPMTVHGGPFTFAIRAKIAGGVPEKKEDLQSGPPMPVEWQTALKDVKTGVLIPDAPLDILWPGRPVSPDEDPQPLTPTEFVTQTLDPTGGEIDRPKDWHYKEGHRDNTLMWTIAKEKNDNGTYTTGVRIQLFVGIKEATGMTPKEFVEQFVEKKRQTEGVRVVEICDAQDQGMFMRVCLEIEEGPHHILYSLFYGKEADMAALTIAGTSKELWHVYSPVFDRMNKFKVIDVKRIQQNAEKEQGK